MLCRNVSWKELWIILVGKKGLEDGLRGQPAAYMFSSAKLLVALNSFSSGAY